MANDKEEQANAGYDAGRNGGDHVSRFFGVGTTKTYWKNYDQGFEDLIKYGKQEQPSFLDAIPSDQPKHRSDSDRSSTMPTAESSTQSYNSTTSSTRTSSPAAGSFASFFLSIAVIVLLIAVFGGAFRDNRTERTSGMIYSPISEAELPRIISPQAKAALVSWLNQNPNFRPAIESDCNCADDLVHIQKSYANQDPYYAAGDFNRDGLTDFAVVVIDRSISSFAAPPNNFNSSILIISSATASSPPKPQLLRAIGVPGSSLLFLNRDNGTLSVGKWEGEVSPIDYSAGSFFYQ